VPDLRPSVPDGNIGVLGDRMLLETPIGPIGISWRGNMLTGVDLEPDAPSETSKCLPDFIADQFDAYFRDGAERLDLAVEVQGTRFQHRVWQALRSIPSGRTITYGELAKQVGGSARAVGGACRANPCPIVVPCHRVVGATGLGGFAGDTSGRKLAVKRWLLRHEGNELF